MIFECREYVQVGCECFILPKIHIVCIFSIIKFRDELLMIIQYVNYFFITTSAKQNVGDDNIVYFCSLKVLSHGGDVPSSAIDTEVDLKYFPDALCEKDIGLRRVCIWIIKSSNTVLSKKILI